MRRLLAGGLLLALAGSAHALSNLVVKVVNSNNVPVPGASVVAIYFNNGQPDQSSSRIGVTDASGSLTFDNASGVGHSTYLVTSDFYQVVAGSEGFLPAVIDQFNGIPPSLAALTPAATPPTITITLSSTGVSGVGEIDVNLTAASANSLVFGQVGLQAGGGAAAYGFAATDNTGAGLLQVLNVSTAPANTYQISAFDSIMNRSASDLVGVDLGVSTPTIDNHFLATLNIGNAPPPVANISQTQSSGQGGSLSVTGVVVDTASVAIPYIQLNFSSQYQDAYGQNFNDWRGAQTDQNGTFQLYGLRAGSTYYTSLYGGCNPNTGLCYQGSQSTAAMAAFGAAPGVNDFLYTSSSAVQNTKITLNQMPPSSGVMAVYVKDQFGNAFPQASIGVVSDGQGWQTAGGASCIGPYINNPGFLNLNTQAATGYVLVTGLPSGNYQLNAWTPYGQATFNAGADGQQGFSGCTTSSPGADDRRLTISTAAGAGKIVEIYDIFGNVVSSGIPSVTVTVTVSTSSTGLVNGTLTFPGVVDLSSSPIAIVLYPQCSPGGSCNGGGGFASFNSASTGPTINYAIPVSSGQAYYLEVTSPYWGPVYPGGNQPQPNLTSTGTAVVDMQFSQAGRITGYMRKPDGGIYIPATGSGGGSPRINAQGNNSWGWTQIKNDGSFDLGGLLPGNYTLSAQANGVSQFPYTVKQPAPNVTVVANQAVNQDLTLADAVTVAPVAYIAALPPLSIVNCSQQQGNGDCPPETWKAYALPQGKPLSASVVTTLLAGGGGSTPNVFEYSVSTGQVNGCNGQFLSQAGFCTTPVAASKTGSDYDFYLLRAGGFDSTNIAGGVRPYFIIESVSTNVVIGPSFAAGIAFSPFGSPSGSTTAVQNVTLTPVPSLAAVPQAVLSGTVTAVNMINQRQFTQLGGNFNNFLTYLPLVWAYDSAGTLKGVGLVAPFPPAESPFDTQLKQSVAAGNFTQFQTLIGPAPGGWGAFGYEIRGLTAGTTYSLIVTTPNYPSYKTSVVLGAANSTTTVNVNLDSNPGATISGAVMTTAGAALAGAQVTVKASGYAATTLTTDAWGAWSLAGLAAGSYQITVVAAGYAQGAQTVDVTGSAVTVPTFSLPLANASIAGTVYTNNPICPAGASCSAFGKTVLQGITVLAYDDTLNVNDPTATLPIYRAVTSSSGTYEIDGLVTADSLGLHSYKLFVNAPGYFVLNQTTVAKVGLVSGFDFALKPKPLDVNVFGHVVGLNYEFQVTNYQSFSSGKAYISASPFGGVLAPGTTDVSTVPGFVPRPDASGVTQLFLDYPLTSLTAGTVYVLHIEAVPNDPRAPKVVKEVTFGKNLSNGVCQSIDQALIGDDSGVNAQGIPNNQASLDITAGGNSSALTLPAGGVIPIASTAIPSMCMSQTDASASPQATIGQSTAAFASGVYSITLSSINYTQKGVDLTLSYPQNGTTLTDLAVYTFDAASQKWQSVPGLQTIDPVKGTIKVKGLKSLASVLGVRGTGIAAAGAGGSGGGYSSLMAVSDGHTYRPNAIILRPDDNALFAIMRPSQVRGGAFTGTIVKVYNFPNPFSLQTKSVPIAAAGAVCAGGAGPIVTDGTVIKYEIPAGISGTGVIRIYTLSGRLVREVDAGNISPSTCYYTTWDGKNRNGQPVANGVYYGVLSVGGSKQSSGTFKLAVIK